MQQFKALRIISLLLVLVTFGCATSKTHVADADFELTAEMAPEGILLAFRNIPEDVTRLWIDVSILGDTEAPESSRNIISSYAGITDETSDGWINSTRQLDKIKQTGKIIFPFVEAGTTYHFTVFASNDNEFSKSPEDFRPLTANAEFTATGNGIYFNRNNVNLEMNDDHTVIALTSEPVFSSEVTFDEQKYSFGVVIAVDNERSLAVGDHHIPNGLSPNGLAWNFEPQMTANFIAEDHEWLENGTVYPAWAQAHINIIYDDIKWSIGIANSPEFNYSL